MGKEWTMDQHRVWIGDEGNVLYVDMQGHWSVAHNAWMTVVVKEFAELVPRPRYAIWKVGGGDQDTSKKARLEMKEDSRARAGIIDKQALVGIPKAARIIAKIMIKMGGEENFSFHDTPEQALASFKE